MEERWYKQLKITSVNADWELVGISLDTDHI